MIVDIIANIRKYVPEIPSLAKVADIIESGLLEGIKPGQYKSDDKHVRYNVFEYDTKEITASKYEVHKKEADVQIILRGKELMKCAWTKPTQMIEAYDEGKDALFVSGITAFTLHAIPETFVIFTPGEPHAPSLLDGESSHVLKVVFKVLV